MKKKIKKISWSKVEEMIFFLLTLVTLLTIYSVERNALILIIFFVCATYRACSLLNEFVKAYRVNSSINLQRYLNERGLKEEEGS